MLLKFSSKSSLNFCFSNSTLFSASSSSSSPRNMHEQQQDVYGGVDASSSLGNGYPFFKLGVPRRNLNTQSSVGSSPASVYLSEPSQHRESQAALHAENAKLDFNLIQKLANA